MQTRHWLSKFSILKVQKFEFKVSSKELRRSSKAKGRACKLDFPNASIFYFIISDFWRIENSISDANVKDVLVVTSFFFWVMFSYRTC